jgi:hypothetical protein
MKIPVTIEGNKYIVYFDAEGIPLAVNHCREDIEAFVWNASFNSAPSATAWRAILRAACEPR